jgi:hypothetical protein
MGYVKYFLERDIFHVICERVVNLRRRFLRLRFEHRHQHAVAQIPIVNRRPRFSINPLMVSLSGDTDSDTPFASLKAGTVAAGTIVGAHHTLTMPRMELLSVAQASREGLVSHDLNYKLLRNGSADAVLDAETCWEFLQGARA